MKVIIFLSILFLLLSCSKPKTVLICGDHVCVNKAEADQYFTENLSIEVKIIDKKNIDELNLVELNLSKDNKGKNEVRLVSKKNTKEDLKTLSNDEITKIKKNIKNKKKNKLMKKKNRKIAKKNIKKADDLNSKKNKEKNKILLNNANKKRIDVVDVCTILKECSIEEISKYLLEQGKKKSFPDITTRA